MQNTPLLVKRCRICGDKASGFNYNGLCCESCKIFFHRSVSNNKIKCFKSRKCEIDIFTRKNCAKCRLDKCLSNGMSLKSCKNNNKSMIEPRQILDRHMQNILLNINFDFLNSAKLKCEYPNPLDLNLPQLPYVVTRKKKYATELIAPERQVISNIQNALDETFVDESRHRVSGQVTSTNDVIELAAIYVQKIVKFCKSIPAFKQLCQTDQLIILKLFFYEILVTRFVYMYDLVKEGFPMIENESSNHALFMKFDLCLNVKSKEFVQQGWKFQIELYEELENDLTIRDLLIAILLFKPRPNLSNPEFVHYQYALYCRLLSRYLEHKYKNVHKSNRKYQSLIRMTNNFDYQTETTRSYIKTEFDVQQIPHIITELLDY